MGKGASKSELSLSERIQWVDTKSIKLHPKNRNKHSDEQIERLSKLIQYQGWRVPLIISNRSGKLAAGHGRLLAAKKLGLKSVPVLYQDFIDDDQENAFRVSDNEIARWAELDLSGLNEDIVDYSPDFDVEYLGLKDFVLEPADKYGDKDADAVPPVHATDIKNGDLFGLGNHRLLCGDSTDKAQVERLMNGEKADMWLTDPPYGVSYTEKNEYLNGLGNGHRLTKPIENDSKTIEEMAEFWRLAADAAIDSCSDKACYYWFACQGGDQMMMMMSLSAAKWKVRHELIWVKNNHVMGRCDYQYKHEPILYGWKKDGTHKFYGGFQTSVLECNKPNASKLHPTMKPIELLEKLVTNSTQKEETIYDGFLGSGSTLIACEKTNRKCYGMEIDPQYCQVIIDRWEKFTGQKAVKIEDKPKVIVRKNAKHRKTTQEGANLSLRSVRRN